MLLGTWYLYMGANRLGRPGSQILSPAHALRGWWWVCEIICPFQTRQNATITANLTRSHRNQETSVLFFILPSRLDAGGEKSSEFVCVCACVCVWKRERESTRVCLLYSLHLFCEGLPPRIQLVATRGLSFSHGSCRAVFSAFYLFLREQTHYTSCIETVKITI